MAGQLKITITDKEWLTDLANNYWEQVQGLGGIAGISPSTGMLFDLGYEQAITVTTEPMLFPLDIAFFSESLETTEVYHDVQPGYHVNSTVPARFFLEVNAGELNGLAAGEQASLEVLVFPTADSAPSWISLMVSLAGFILLGVMLVDLVKGITAATPAEPQKLNYLPETKKRKPESLLKMPEGLSVVRLLEKWRTVKSRNSTLALRDLEALGPDYDTTDCKQALADYQGIERTDYSDQEEYQEARDEAWESFLECLESLSGEEEENMAAEKQPSPLPGRGQILKGNSLDYLVDSPEYLTQTIEDIGYRDKIDTAFQGAIARARGRR